MCLSSTDSLSIASCMHGWPTVPGKWLAFTLCFGARATLILCCRPEKKSHVRWKNSSKLMTQVKLTNSAAQLLAIGLSMGFDWALALALWLDWALCKNLLWLGDMSFSRFTPLAGDPGFSLFTSLAGNAGFSLFIPLTGAEASALSSSLSSFTRTMGASPTGLALHQPALQHAPQPHICSWDPPTKALGCDGCDSPVEVKRSLMNSRVPTQMSLVDINATMSGPSSMSPSPTPCSSSARSAAVTGILVPLSRLFYAGILTAITFLNSRTVSLYLW